MGDLRLAPPQRLTECREDAIRGALEGPLEGFGEVEAYPSLEAKAAVLAYRVVKNHPCPDGNKRLAVLLVSAFLELNGLSLEAGTDDLESVFRDLAASSAGDYRAVLASLEDWFSQTIAPLEEA